MIAMGRVTMRFTMKLALRALSCLALVWPAGIVLAEPPAALKLYIQSQPISDALNEFARQSGLQVFFLASEESKGVVSTALRGSYEDAKTALSRLLANTGLDYEYLDARTVAIRAARSSGPGTSRQTAADESAVRALRVAQVSTAEGASQDARPGEKPGAAAGTTEQSPGSSAAGGEEQVEQIIIRGARTSTATKMNAPILSVPQNIQVLSSRFIDDIGADLLEDALRHVAGVAVGGFYNGWDFFRIRGFDGVSYLDGLRTDTLGLNAEVFGLDRIEVLKGPSSTLYGEGLLSGMVNIVSKRPKREAFFEAAATGGDFHFREASVDFGGSLNAAQTVYARLPVLYREDGSFVDFVDGLERIYIAPSITWEIGERTRLTILTTYQKDRNELAFPLPAFGTVLPNSNGEIPVTRFIGDGNDPGVTRDESWALGYQLTHELNDWVSFRQSVRQRRRGTDWDRIIYPWFINPDQRTLARYAYFIDDERDRDFNADTGIELQFSSGRLRHHMTAGTDFTHATNHARSGFYGFDLPEGMDLDLFDPVDRGAAAVIPPELFPGAEKSQSLGFYLQDRIEFTDRLSMMIGGRYQKVDGGFSGTIDPDDSQMVGGSAFVPNVGFSYEVRQGLHAYASYSEAFKGQFDRRVASGDPSDPDGDPADPEEGAQYEVGLKAGLMDNRLNGTFSVYELTRRNVLQTDFGNPDFYLLTGEQRSRGVELDSQLLLKPNWEVIASIAYTDAEVTRDVTTPVGSPLRNVPRETLSLWSKYRFDAGILRGLAVSLGGSYYSKQAGKDVAPRTPDDPDDIESFDLPSYVLVDANVTYQWNRTRFALTFNNLLDEKFFIGSYNENYVLPGTPRSVRFTVGWTY